MNFLKSQDFGTRPPLRKFHTDHNRYMGWRITERKRIDFHWGEGTAPNSSRTEGFRWSSVITRASHGLVNFAISVVLLSLGTSPSKDCKIEVPPVRGICTQMALRFGNIGDLNFLKELNRTESSAWTVRGKAKDALKARE